MTQIEIYGFFTKNHMEILHLYDMLKIMYIFTCLIIKLLLLQQFDVHSFFTHYRDK